MKIIHKIPMQWLITKMTKEYGYLDPIEEYSISVGYMYKLFGKIIIFRRIVYTESYPGFAVIQSACFSSTDYRPSEKYQAAKKAVYGAN